MLRPNKTSYFQTTTHLHVRAPTFVLACGGGYSSLREWGPRLPQKQHPIYRKYAT